MGNAVKFTDKGEIAVHAGLVEDTEKEALLKFSVRDTGIGIPKDKLEILFHKFTQVDASTTRKYGGTGLGLAISKQLSELMGGEIGVKSKPGKGSEFWFTARLGKQNKAVEQEESIPENLHGVRILVVDDNASSRDILAADLTSYGMRAEQADGGPEALQALNRAAAEQDPFKIALIDMRMPDVDGEALGRIIKADDRLRGLLMVMMTSLGLRGEVQRLEEIGFTAILTKPLRRKELKTILSMALSGRDPDHSRTIVTQYSAQEPSRPFVGVNARILLAEDNITNQQVALGILKKLGLKAEAAANGLEAVKALEAAPYDLVFMDVQMPEMDGLEAARRIRSSSSKVRDHKIPIIAMTAHAMKDDRERCLKAGMDDYVSKPISPAALTAVLKKWLPTSLFQPESEGNKETATEENLKQTDEALVWDKAGMLERLMDDEELAVSIIDAFIDDIPKQILDLEGKLERGDAAGAELLAHRIKGAASHVGGETLRDAALMIEKSSHEGNTADFKNPLESLKIEFERLKQAMTRA